MKMKSNESGPQIVQTGQEAGNQDIQNRIDTSDQDENASYEDINDDDLKSHNNSDDKYSEIEKSELNTIEVKNQDSTQKKVQPTNMGDQQNYDEDYSDDVEDNKKPI